MKIKLHQFGSRIGEKPFKVQLDQGGIVTGLSDENYWYRFTSPIVVKRGDSFSAANGKGLLVNGEARSQEVLSAEEDGRQDRLGGQKSPHRRLSR
jgi:hypothetical protein